MFGWSIHLPLAPCWSGKLRKALLSTNLQPADPHFGNTGSPPVPCVVSFIYADWWSFCTFFPELIFVDHLLWATFYCGGVLVITSREAESLIKAESDLHGIIFLSKSHLSLHWLEGFWGNGHIVWVLLTNYLVSWNLLRSVYLQIMTSHCRAVQ